MLLIIIDPPLLNAVVQVSIVGCGSMLLSTGVCGVHTTRSGANSYYCTRQRSCRASLHEESTSPSRGNSSSGKKELKKYIIKEKKLVYRYMYIYMYMYLFDPSSCTLTNKIN